MSKTSQLISSTLARTLTTAALLLFCLQIWLPLFAVAKDQRAFKKAAKSNLVQLGKWTDGFSTGPAVHLHVLPNGKVLSWAQWQSEPGIYTFARLWDPSLNTVTDVFNDSVYLFCSGHSLLPDGKLLITGGTTYRGPYYDGINKTTIFNYQNSTWTNYPALPEMNAGRWYPTNLALGNGETLVVSGTYKINKFVFYNTLPQVFTVTPQGGTWRNLTGAEMIDPRLPLYPWIHLVSNGKVFYSGPTKWTVFLTTTGNGSVIQGPESLVGYRDEGSAVMYDEDKVMIVGGGNPPKKSAEIIDLSLTSPTWAAAAEMEFPRRHLDTTILADGTVLATGGTSGEGFNNTCHPVYAAEIWDPVNDAWTTVASMSYPRLYHSTAVLLPDARVLVGGSTAWGAEPQPSPLPPCPAIDNQYQTEIFTPPYLYNSSGNPATRPQISSAPADATYGQSIPVVLGAAEGIRDVTLIRLSSTTHSFNQNQRFNRLRFVRDGANLSVTIPYNSNACPPGHYMLFVINTAGVPSEAKIIRVH